MAMQRVGVIGAGTMGNRIAHMFARGGFNVVLCDVEQRFLDRGLDTIGKSLEREVVKNKISAADKAAALGRITPVLDRAKWSDSELIVEAATEKFVYGSRFGGEVGEDSRGSERCARVCFEPRAGCPC
jgi:3-hydroxybutyryl-CoA dehydrogenase